MANLEQNHADGMLGGVKKSFLLLATSQCLSTYIKFSRWDQQTLIYLRLLEASQHFLIPCCSLVFISF